MAGEKWGLRRLRVSDHRLHFNSIQIRDTEDDAMRCLWIGEMPFRDQLCYSYDR